MMQPADRLIAGGGDGVWPPAGYKRSCVPGVIVPGVRADQVLGRIDTDPGCSVKDSFGDLDLSAHGFVVLFDAWWLFRAAATSPSRVAHGWQLIATDDELEQWAIAADLAGIIRPELLQNPTVRVLVASRP